MQIALKIALTLLGLLFIFMGAGFLFDPAQAAGDFGIDVAGTHGLTSIRADLTAFFLVAGVVTVWGIWADRRDLLLVSAGLMGIALITRLVSAAQFGTFEGWITPIVVEAATCALALVAIRNLPRTS